MFETRVGRDLSESLNAAVERMQSRSFEWAVSALEINREVGGELAHVLATVAGSGDHHFQHDPARGRLGLDATTHQSGNLGDLMSPIVIIGAAAVIGSFFVAWWAVAAKTPASVDLQAGDGTAADLRSRQLLQGASERLGTPLLERLGQFARRWSPAGWLDGMSRKLASAGSPEGWTVERLLGVKVVLGVALGLLTMLAVAGDFSLSGLLLIVAAASIGFFTPDVLLTRRVEQRKDAIRGELSSVIDQLSMMVQAGLGIDAAIARAAQSNEGPLAEEFARVGHDVRVGVDRSVALDNLAERADVPELKSFVAALAQADRLGSPVSQTLEIQSQEIRVKRRQFAEEQAMKLPVKLLFPMVFCILPVLMVVLLAPAGIKIFDTLG